MGGKGRKRREKNYRASHGGFSRLPPPPDASKVDALPSKLRKLMSLTSSQHQGSVQVLRDSRKKQKREEDGSKKKSPPNSSETELRSSGITNRENDENLKTSQLVDPDNNTVQNESNKKGKRKRKRNEVKDLRFEEILKNSDRHSKKHERMKKYFEGIKKKHKKIKPEVDLHFPRREHIKFGEVVEAPPKLVTVPKASKISHDASQERIRLRAVEAYRNRKGWTSRPGIQLPPTKL